MHFIHLNINSILPKIDEMRYIAKLTNAIIIGLSETKLDNAVLSSGGGAVASFLQKLYFI